MSKIFKSVIYFFSLLSFFTAEAQTTSLSLDSCYILARTNYPLVRQYDLISKSTEYTIENANRGYLPQININAQATYQSAVVELPFQIPGVEPLSKDQYKVYAELYQPIYDGGVVKQQKKIQKANSLLEQQKLETELYKLKSRVEQLFFGILMIEEQLKQTSLIQNDIQNGIKRTQGAVDNGAAFKSSVDLLKAEALKIEQRVLELQANKRAFTNMLGLLIGMTLDEETKLITPASPAGYAGSINRPELLLFEYQRNSLDKQNGLLSAVNRPKLNLFFQGGYGRPAFNILSNDFEPYYIGGFRLNIPISGFYTLKNQRNLIDLNKRSVDLQQETFLLNTNLTLNHQSEEINKLQALLNTDEEIIRLRGSVKSAASAQLENGVITSSDYLREVNAEDAARQTRILHNIQLLMAQYQQKTSSGN